jgi:uncharacterized DUF497 family protein
MTTYTWDEAKRQHNLCKHGLDFADAATVIEDINAFTVEDLRYPYNEQRFLTLGFFDGQEVAIAHTERNYGTRIISFRKATRRERETLFGVHK